jgi:hypothetical protein
MSKSLYVTLMILTYPQVLIHYFVHGEAEAHTNRVTVQGSSWQQLWMREARSQNLQSKQPPVITGCISLLLHFLSWLCSGNGMGLHEKKKIGPILGCELRALHLLGKQSTT